VGETSWIFLLVGSFAAVGAAMALGTLAALVRYRRTGTFPGHEGAVTATRRQVVGLYIRIAVGVVLTIVGVVALVRSGVV
jgi:hypothetical protein